MTKNTHALCKLNPAVRGGRKWQPQHWLTAQPGDTLATLQQRCIDAGQATEREFRRSQVRIVPAAELQEPPSIL